MRKSNQKSTTIKNKRQAGSTAAEFMLMMALIVAPMAQFLFASNSSVINTAMDQDKQALMMGLNSYSIDNASSIDPSTGALVFPGAEGTDPVMDNRLNLKFHELYQFYSNAGTDSTRCDVAIYVERQAGTGLGAVISEQLNPEFPTGTGPIDCEDGTGQCQDAARALFDSDPSLPASATYYCNYLNPQVAPGGDTRPVIRTLS